MNTLVVLIVIVVLSYLLSRTVQNFTGGVGIKKVAAKKAGPGNGLEEEVRRLNREVRKLRRRMSFSYKWMNRLVNVVLIVVIVLALITFWPIGPVRAITVTKAQVSANINLGPKLLEWAKKEGLSLAIFSAVVERAKIPRDTVTGRPVASGGSTIDPWTVYAIYAGENFKGWENNTPDPRKDSSAGTNVAWDALANRFGASSAETIRQREALKKIVAQAGLQEKYPGLSTENCHGSIAGALGVPRGEVPQGMPAQSAELMADWIEAGIYDPWGDANSIAEFTIRYLVRKYATGGREAAWQSYNPGGPTSYFSTLRTTAQHLEASYQQTFGKNTIADDQLTTEGQQVIQAETTETQVGEATETMLSLVLGKVGELDDGLKARMEELETNEGKVLVGRVFRDLKNIYGVLDFPVHSTRIFLKGWATTAYSILDPNGTLFTVNEVTEELRGDKPLATDIVVTMDMTQRIGGENGVMAKNIRWILARAVQAGFTGPDDPELAKATFRGQVVLKPSEKFNYVKSYGLFRKEQSYLSYGGTEGAGACDLATQMYKLTLLTPGLKPWRGEPHAKLGAIPGFGLDEGVLIEDSRETANLTVENTSDQTITIFWLLEPKKVTMWSGTTSTRSKTKTTQIKEVVMGRKWESPEEHVVELVEHQAPDEFPFDGALLAASMDDMDPLKSPIVVRVRFVPGSDAYCMDPTLTGEAGVYEIVMGLGYCRIFGADGTFSHEFGHILQNELGVLFFDCTDECCCLQCEATGYGRKWVPEGIFAEDIGNPRVLKDCTECGVEVSCKEEEQQHQQGR